MLTSPSVLAFFGLTPEYRGIIFREIHDLVYHGGGGFIHSEVYNMPVWLRQFHIKKINEYNRKQEEELKKQKTLNNPNKKVTGPNIRPSTSFNL